MTARSTEHRDGVNDCRDAIEMLGQLEDVHLETPATRETIERAEAILGVTLPPSLGLFVAEVGGVTIHGREVLGLSADDFATDCAVNIVGASLLERPSGLPDRCVVVCNNGHGTRTIVDIDDGGIVREWTPRSGERGAETYPHFGRFLLELVSDALGDEKEAKFRERRRAQLERLNRKDGD